MEYNLTKKQKEGLDICLKRYKDKEKYTIIAGYAGTGKSYLVNAIVDAFGFKENEVAYASYTGKAALVLQNQGKNATTLHRLLYRSYPDGYGNFIRKPIEHLDSNLKLIIIDEISMCPKEMWSLLLSHNIYIIGLGDPFQLPPIGDDLHLLDNPHIFLTEVMRQALDSDIIKYSLSLREGENLEKNIKGNDIQTISKENLNSGMLLWADQVLCGKNVTRKKLNNQIRLLLNKKGIVDENEKLICTKNYWDKMSKNGDFLVNGLIGFTKNLIIDNKKIKCDFCLENEHYFDNLSLDYNLLENGKPTIIKTKLGKILPNFLIEMDYGYVITVHKAQGSQFEKVLIYDDYWLQGIDYRRWLYTAITRAINKVVILL